MGLNRQYKITKHIFVLRKNEKYKNHTHSRGNNHTPKNAKKVNLLFSGGIIIINTLFQMKRRNLWKQFQKQRC